MDCKGQWRLRCEALSSAIHFEHVPLEGRTETLSEEEHEDTTKGEVPGGGEVTGRWSTVPIIVYLGDQVECGGLQTAKCLVI